MVFLMENHSKETAAKGDNLENPKEEITDLKFPRRI